MKVALVYNTKAGSCQHDAEEIVARFAQAGHEILHVSADHDWDALIVQGVQRVLIVGGDGTIEAVLPHLIGRQTPFFVLPCGTANNIAKSLDQVNSLPQVVSAIAHSRVLELDVGLVHSASCQQYFFEAVGAGLFVELMKHLRQPDVKAELEPEGPPDQKLARLREYLKTIAAASNGFDCRLTVDGQEVSGRLLLAEVMNMKLIGPNLALAPSTYPGDGWFDLVLVRDHQRNDLLEYLKGLQQGEIKDFPFECRPCRAVVFQQLPPAIHVDDEIFEPTTTPTSIGIKPGALKYLRVGDR